MPYPSQGSAAAAGVSGNCQVALVQYTGNNGGDATSQEVTGVGFEPDLILIFVDEALAPYCGPRYVFASNSTATNAYGMVMGGSDNDWDAIANTDAIVPTSDGFTLTKTEANADSYTYTALCVKLS